MAKKQKKLTFQEGIDQLEVATGKTPEEVAEMVKGFRKAGEEMGAFDSFPQARATAVKVSGHPDGLMLMWAEMEDGECLPVTRADRELLERPSQDGWRAFDPGFLFVTLLDGRVLRANYDDIWREVNASRRPEHGHIHYG